MPPTEETGQYDKSLFKYFILFCKYLIIEFYLHRVCPEHKKSAQVEKTVRSTNFNPFWDQHLLSFHHHNDSNKQEIMIIIIAGMTLQLRPRYRNLTRKTLRRSSSGFGAPTTWSPSSSLSSSSSPTTLSSS